MSYEDGDVSMSSCMDESFNMSVQHDAIEVVWASTQSPAVTSILEESKLNRQKIKSSDWKKGEDSFLFSGSTGATSLFKDTTARRPKLSFGDSEPTRSDTLTRPFVNRSSSTPIISTETNPRNTTASQHLPVDPRRVRPSQRQSLLQSSRLESMAGIGNDSATESLEALREMIQGVSRRWNTASVQPPSTATNTNPGSTSAKASNGQSSDLLPRLQLPVLESKYKPKGIHEKSDQQTRSSSNPKEGNGLMLPPAVPTSKQRIVKDKIWQAKAEKDDMDIPDISIIIDKTNNRYPPPDLLEPVSPCPKERTRLHSETSFHPQPTFTSSPLRPSRSNSSLGTKPTAISSTFPTSSASPQTGAPITLNGQKKALGMRRTASGNRFEAPSTSRPNSIESSAHQPSEKSKSVSIPQAYSHSQSQSQFNRTHESTQNKPRSFQVPWARQSPHTVAQVLTDPYSPTEVKSVPTGPSSQASQSGSDSARSPDGPTSVLEADKTFAMNCDDSYSFDDVDVEELHQVLSQCGA